MKLVLENDCNYIVNVCGRVFLVMWLMCGIMEEENVLFFEFLKELKDLFFVEVLDDESFFDDVWLKIIINRFFERLFG